MLGKIVFYVMDHGPRKGELCPAIVTRVNPDGSFNLLVFADGRPEGEGCDTYWKANIQKDESAELHPRTYRWSV